MKAKWQLYRELDAATESALRTSIERFGILVPVAKDQNGNILDGHQRARIAGELHIDFPVTVIPATNDEEAAEIARSLNEDRRAMPKEQRLPVSAALRQEGHSVRAIAGALGVGTSTVQRDLSTVPPGTVPDHITGLDGRSRPAKHGSKTVPKPDKSRAATAERRRRIRELAAEGHTAQQIGVLVGMSEGSVKNVAKQLNIDLVADRVMGRTRRPDNRRIVTVTVANLEAEVIGLNELPETLGIQPEEAKDLADSLAKSIRELRRLLLSLRRIT